MSILSNMGNDTKIAAAVFALSGIGYLISRHFDKKATEQALKESPQSQQVQQGDTAVEPVNP